MMVVMMMMDFQGEEPLVDFQTFRFGLDPGSEGEGKVKRGQTVRLPPSPSAPGPPALSPLYAPA